MEDLVINLIFWPIVYIGFYRYVAKNKHYERGIIKTTLQMMAINIGFFFVGASIIAGSLYAFGLERFSSGLAPVFVVAFMLPVWRYSNRFIKSSLNPDA